MISSIRFVFIADRAKVSRQYADKTSTEGSMIKVEIGSIVYVDNAKWVVDSVERDQVVLKTADGMGTKYLSRFEWGKAYKTKDEYYRAVEFWYKKEREALDKIKAKRILAIDNL